MHTFCPTSPANAVENRLRRLPPGRRNAQIRVGFSTFRGPVAAARLRQTTAPAVQRPPGGSEERMEPTSIDTAQRAREGRPGSLDNPEVYAEHVPGHVIPILEREFDDFDTEAKRFLDGQTEETEFIKFRLKQGVYGQRQANVQMIRTKLPMGGITPDQMDTFADVIEEW